MRLLGTGLTSGKHLRAVSRQDRHHCPASTGGLRRGPNQLLGASDRNGFPWWLSGKESARNAGLIPGSRRTPGGGNDKPLQYSCLENPMDRGAWQATVFGSQTRLSNSTTVTGMANWKDSSGIPVGIGIQVGGGIPGPWLQLHQPVHQCPEQKGVGLPRL